MDKSYRYEIETNENKDLTWSSNGHFKRGSHCYQKNISVGGRCVCNGHADTCDKTNGDNPNKLLCNCEHNTCGEHCEYCCPGFLQKKWQPARKEELFVCEPCECYGHSDTCIYDAEVDRQRLSIDIHGNREGGGVCLNCEHNTGGNNCETCIFGYYRALDVVINSTEVCKVCNCNDTKMSTGDCKDITGDCECHPQYTGSYCDRCNVGYHTYPDCLPCDCFTNGTLNDACISENGDCSCKPQYAGQKCDMCANEFYSFPECKTCECHARGSLNKTCNKEDGSCICKDNYTGRTCSMCHQGFFGFPDCQGCDCETTRVEDNICDIESGHCFCKSKFSGPRCEKCAPGYYGFPHCEECSCPLDRSINLECDNRGRCNCQPQFTGEKCEYCAVGFYDHLTCNQCNCHLPGSLGGINICNTTTGSCRCKHYVKGHRCDSCKDGFYGLQSANIFGCNDCNCDVGGARGNQCTKITGQCSCKTGTTGRPCNRLSPKYYIPTLHQLKYEFEDGYTSDFPNVDYAFKDEVFPGYSWRGYATLTAVHPNVHIRINIQHSGIYRMLVYYVNSGKRLVDCDVTLMSGTLQEARLLFLPNQDPLYATATKNGILATFLLDSGVLVVSVVVKEPVFLDYMVLVPEAYYEPTLLHYYIYEPCPLQGSHKSCIQFQFADVADFISINGESGYTIDNGTMAIELHADDIMYKEFGTPLRGYIGEDQQSFLLDVDVSHAGKYLLIIKYFTPTNGVSQRITVSVGESNQTAQVNLFQCSYTVLCRNALLGQDRLPYIFSLGIGTTTLNISNMAVTTIVIHSLVLVPLERWDIRYIKPFFKCIRNGSSCTESMFEMPPRSVAVEVEGSQTEGRVATDLPEDIYHTNTGLIKLTQEESTFDLYTSLESIGEYMVVFHYYLPYYISSEVLVSLEYGGQKSTGVVHFEACPGVSGCRVVMNVDDRQDNVIDLTSLGVHLTVYRVASSSNIWIDYVVFVPVSQFDNSILQYAAVGRNRDFLSQCVDSDYTFSNLKEFCVESLFSITTYFNDGALPCGCNIHGSTGLDCGTVGGQCPCKQNVIGRDCSACKSGYFGFPNCQVCLCEYGKCDIFTGECVCPSNVIGDKCEVCTPGHYGYNPVTGCKECRCSVSGLLDELDSACDNVTGQCRCSENIGGRKCDECLNGYYNYPACSVCDCKEGGTTESICNKVTGECLCKVNVEGGRCDRCVSNTFDLDTENPNGCTNCFCFGVTDDCKSSTLTWSEIMEMSGWLMNHTSHSLIEEDGLSANAEIAENSEAIYWISPDVYTAGDRAISYGASLRYSFWYSYTDNNSLSDPVNYPDILLQGTSFSVVHFVSSHPMAEEHNNVTVKLFEFNFRHDKTFTAVSREQFMMLLVNLESIRIRASYDRNQKHIRLSNVSLQVAVENIVGDVANSVESCKCHSNYEGTSCQSCAAGYWRSTAKPYLGLCSPCDCNGHSDMCDSVTGQCFNCTDNTSGLHCESCRPRYYFDSFTGSCQLCPCPLSTMSNSFSRSCVANGKFIECECDDGYAGNQCEICGPGHYGNPTHHGDFCKPCQCNNNIDPSDPQSCNHTTGACTVCINQSSGDSCELCADWYYGNATEQQCQECTCDHCGTNACDRDNGACSCQPNVIGENCEHCAPETFGFSNCSGCLSCDCGLGAQNNSCDPSNGQCLCHIGIGGRTCDHCAAGYWNFTNTGCQACGCDLLGASEACDVMSGKCNCLPGYTGETCDRCFPRWAPIPGKMCIECDKCIDKLLDASEEDQLNISAIYPAMEDVYNGILANRKLANSNDSLYSYKVIFDGLAYGDDMVTFLYNESNNLLNESYGFVSRIPETIGAGNSIQCLAKSLLNKMLNATADTNIITELVIMRLNESLLGMEASNISYYLNESYKISELLFAVNFTSRTENVSEECMTALEVEKLIKNWKMEFPVQDVLVEPINESMTNMMSVLNDLLELSEISLNVTNSSLHVLLTLNETYVDDKIEELKVVYQNMSYTIKETASWLIRAKSMKDSGWKRNSVVNKVLSRVEKSDDELAKKVKYFSEFSETLPWNLSSTAVDHATSLQADSEELERLYLEEIGMYALNAVKAATVYSNISNLAENATWTIQNSYNKTQLIEDMLELTMDQHDLLRNITNQFKRVTDTIKVMSNKVVLNKLMTIKQDIGMARESLIEMNRTRKELLANLHYLSSKNVGTKINESLENTRNITTQLDLIQQRMANKTDAMEGLQQTMNTIPRIIANTTETVNISEENVLLANESYIHSVSVVKNISRKLDSISNLKRGMNYNMTALREKIQLARSAAKQIPVGVEFLGNTSILLRIPGSLEETSVYTELSLFLKPKQTDGLILYLGSRTDSNSDYLIIYLKNGSVVVSVNLGDDATITQRSSLLELNKWIQVIVRRIGRYVETRLLTDTHKEETIKAEIDGYKFLLDLSGNTTVFLLGGTMDLIKFPLQEKLVNFTGSMEGLVFNGDEVGMWDFTKGVNNKMGATERNILRPSTSSSFSLDGTGYVILDTSAFSWNPSKESDVLLSIKTYSPVGFLFFMSGGEDYMSLEMSDGHITFMFYHKETDGLVSLKSPRVYNDGEWHSIQASRQLNVGVLQVDRIEVARNSSRGGNLTILSLSENVFIGGYTETLLKSGSVSIKKGFRGCIDGLQLGSTKINIVNNKQARGLTLRCLSKKMLTAIYKGSGEEYFLLEEEDLGSEFDLIFSFATYQQNVSLVTAVDANKNVKLNVSLSMLGIEVTFFTVDEYHSLISERRIYNDGFKHYIALSLNDEKLVMNIDEDDIDGVFVPETPHISEQCVVYFGNLPDILRNPNEMNTNFSGCIGNVVLNGRLIGLTTIKNDNRPGVLFSNCQIGLAEVTETTTDSVTTTSETTKTTVATKTIVTNGMSSTLNGLADMTNATVSSSRHSTIITNTSVLTYTNSTTTDSFTSSPCASYGNMFHEGVRLLGANGSRIEIAALQSSSYTIESNFTLHFLTMQSTGILFYMSDISHMDFISLYLKDNQLHYAYNCGSGSVTISSSSIVSDGKWHEVTFYRKFMDGTLYLDGEVSGSDKSPGSSSGINNIIFPIYIGGIPDDTVFHQQVSENLQGISDGFIGCIKDKSLTKNLITEKNINTQPCYQPVKANSIFLNERSRLVLFDAFNVGANLSINFLMKPYRDTGRIFSVHSEHDFMMLQISRGELLLSTNNGHDTVNSTYTPEYTSQLCDGEWHNITAIKKGSGLKLIVDDHAPDWTYSHHPSFKSADTNDTFFLGGPIDTDGYVGCIKDVSLNDVIHDMKTGRGEGDIIFDYCP